MTQFDPSSISQQQLHSLRNAAEQAWGDDTRHQNFQGHPHPSAGQCYVTSKWLTTKLGGHIGLKNGHYFWVSPDKKYIIDLTGDQFTKEPVDLKYRGIKLDKDDPGWEPMKEHASYLPGPIMYKKSDHPLYKGFRIKTDHQRPQDRRDWEDVEYSTNPRATLFKQRADEAYDRA